MNKKEEEEQQRKNGRWIEGNHSDEEMLARCRPDGGKGGVLVGIWSWMDSESYTLSQGKNHAREMRKALPHPKKVIKRSGQIRTGQVRSGQVRSGQIIVPAWCAWELIGTLGMSLSGNTHITKTRTGWDPKWLQKKGIDFQRGRKNDDHSETRR